MFKLKVKDARSMFFDTAAVMSAVDRARGKALSRFGAFVRQAAKTSIRKRKGISRPGEPPHSHAGHLRRLILFGWDSASQSVVIGPLPFRHGEAAELLEFGGVVVRRRDRRGTPAAINRGGAAPGPQRMVYRKRPFMGPALEKEAPQLPEMWRDAVKA